ncbi:MAG: hypothetical protein P0S94_02965, partial [Simkaniaceae bacterium]|nr:hypothetical protein [Simkaniaceae bacterium]
MLYVQNNEVYIENKQAHWGITRAILSIFGGRDYRLESILAKHDVKELSIKQAKKCGLDASIIDVLNDPKNTKNVDFLTPELNGKLMQLMKTA